MEQVVAEQVDDDELRVHRLGPVLEGPELLLRSRVVLPLLHPKDPLCALSPVSESSRGPPRTKGRPGHGTGFQCGLGLRGARTTSSRVRGRATHLVGGAPSSADTRGPRPSHKGPSDSYREVGPPRRVGQAVDTRATPHPTPTDPTGTASVSRRHRTDGRYRSSSLLDSPPCGLNPRGLTLDDQGPEDRPVRGGCR